MRNNSLLTSPISLLLIVSLLLPLMLACNALSCGVRAIPTAKRTFINTNIPASFNRLNQLNMIGSFFKDFSTTSSKGGSINTVAITGASGLIGKELSAKLQSRNIKVIQITTNTKVSGDNVISWDPSNGQISSPERLEGVDAVINLAGENIGSGEGPLAAIGRWSPSKKEKILSSRVNSIRLLAATFESLKKKPKVFLTASAIGFYGCDDSSVLFDESAPRGKGFLADVCVAVEEETNKVQKLGIRAVPLRIGVNLSTKGGIIQKLSLPFKFGLGGIIGNGQQGFSWISTEDCVRGIEFVLDNASLNGPVNVVAPSPVTNAEFTAAFGKAINRPTIVPLPEFAAKIVFGEFGDEVLLGGQKVVPSKLSKAGFKFKDEDIESALKRILS